MTQKRTHRFDRVGKLEATWSGCSTHVSRRTWANNMAYRYAKVH